MLVAASRFAEVLIPSSERLFWISRWPAPLKLRPMSLVRPPGTGNPSVSLTVPTSAVCDASCANAFVARIAAATTSVDANFMMSLDGAQQPQSSQRPQSKTTNLLCGLCGLCGSLCFVAPDPRNREFLIRSEGASASPNCVVQKKNFSTSSPVRAVLTVAELSVCVI